MIPVFEHEDVVESHHRFSNVVFRGQPWDLSHLDAFAIRVDVGIDEDIDVVILFSSHCFTHTFKHDGRPIGEIPDDEVYDDGIDPRVLCEERYMLSRTHLRDIVCDLPKASIRFGAEYGRNFFTFRLLGVNDAPGLYAVFFEVKKDRKRKRRVLLHVQSAYRLTELTKRQKSAGKIKLTTLIRAAYKERAVHQ